MRLCKYLLIGLPGLMLVILCSACSLFKNPEDTVKIVLLHTIKNRCIPKIIWTTSVNNDSSNLYSNLHLSCYDGMVYTANSFGIVKALYATNGKEKWKIDLSKKIGIFSKHVSALLSGGITANGNYIYIGSERAQIYALNNKDGSIAWQKSISGEVLSRPIVSNNLVLLHTSNGMVQALDQKNGAIKWSVSIGTPAVISFRSETAPSSALGGVIVSNDKGRISAISIQQGQLIWQQQLSQMLLDGSSDIEYLRNIDTTPVILKDIVYVLAGNGKLVALDLHSGQIRWEREMHGVRNLLIDEQCIYLINDNYQINALHINNGLSLWNQNHLPHHKLTSPVLFNGYLVVCDNQGCLYWIKRSNGQYIAQQCILNTSFQTAPIVLSDKLFIQSQNGTVYAIRFQKY
ncbi:outer membrane protein assembly factor BamB [Candidatus Pantoea carbekii]|uniref:outer membrane protein assembly factor BamB n=1 Tax=Candidatus Pantoea carbekii TaxID=1235990 RepID=UPI0006187B45|nr:outer membrane protein assembly factor BamB [Candidatus Pantoea carbekii]AKC31860.1 lipoprotein YfgL precursor [Candidatus Pantoea carbekii]